MSNRTPIKAGALLTGPAGVKLVALSDENKAGGVMVETAEGVEPYEVTHLPALSLKSRKATRNAPSSVQATPPADPLQEVGQYGVSFFKNGDPDRNVVMTVVVDVERPTDAAGITLQALEELRNDPQANVDVDEFGTLAPERVAAAS